MGATKGGLHLASMSRKPSPGKEDLSWDGNAKWKLARPRGLWENNVPPWENRAQKWCIKETFKWRHRAGRQSPQEEAALQISAEAITCVRDQALDESMQRRRIWDPSGRFLGSFPARFARLQIPLAPRRLHSKHLLLLVYLLFLLSSHHSFSS